MAKEAVFTMKLEPEPRDAFMAEAATLDRPASQIVRELMKESLARRDEERSQDAYVHRMVGRAMESVAAGRGLSNEEDDARLRRGAQSGSAVRPATRDEHPMVPRGRTRPEADMGLHRRA